jgi:hypothetical protein
VGPIGEGFIEERHLKVARDKVFSSANRLQQTATAILLIAGALSAAAIAGGSPGS